ncbi:hypothetical protein [Sporosarcina luteola]|nr:hypothetical protein [Sporosarcina luteola]
MMKEEMEHVVKNYHWMINSIKIIRIGGSFYIPKKEDGHGY